MTTINKQIQHAPYRSREQIYTEILMSIKSYENRGGIGFTKILFITRCSSNQLKIHLAHLTDSGLIIRLNVGRDVAPSYDGKKRMSRRGDTWHITSKGIGFLNMVEEMNHSMPGIKI